MALKILESATGRRKFWHFATNGKVEFYGEFTAKELPTPQAGTPGGTAIIFAVRAKHEAPKEDIAWAWGYRFLIGLRSRITDKDNCLEFSLPLVFRGKKPSEINKEIQKAGGVSVFTSAFTAITGVKVTDVQIAEAMEVYIEEALSALGKEPPKVQTGGPVSAPKLPPPDDAPKTNGDEAGGGGDTLPDGEEESPD